MEGMNKRSAAARARRSGLVAEQRSSGLTVPKFCLERGIAASSLFGWRRKLAREALVRESGADGRSAPPRFVEALVEDDRQRSAGVSIELTCGRRVSVGRGFDRRVLLEVIGVLEAGVPGASW